MSQEQQEEVAEDSLEDSFAFYMLVEFLGQVPVKDSIKEDMKDIKDIVKDKSMEAAVGGLAGLGDW
jgi:hypothetical protein